MEQRMVGNGGGKGRECMGWAKDRSYAGVTGRGRNYESLLTRCAMQQGCKSCLSSTDALNHEKTTLVLLEIFFFCLLRKVLFISYYSFLGGLG